MAFKKEKDLFDLALSSNFIKELTDNRYGLNCCLTEPKNLFGIPDLVIANINIHQTSVNYMKVYAFEMKLSNWKRALSQAFRYKSFANLSYVLIDRSKSSAALSNLEQFKRANVGLLAINNLGLIHCYHKPNYDEPYSKRLTENLKQIVLKETKTIN